MLKDDAMIVEEFRKVVVSNFKEVLYALPAIIPQTKEDEILFKRGMANIAEMVNSLEHVESIREVGRYIDIEKVLEDYDVDSIRMLGTNLNQSSNKSIQFMRDTLESLRNGDD